MVMHDTVRTDPPTPGDLARAATTTAEKAVAKSTIRRGDVWFVASDPQRPAVGTELWADRPGVVVSNNVSSNRSGFVQVVFLTSSTRKRSSPTHVDVGDPLGDRRRSMALVEQVHTVDVSRLVRRCGHVEPARMREVDNALMFSLSIRRDPQDATWFRKWEEHIKDNGADLAAEIQALSGTTTDQRVQALGDALRLATTQLAAYRVLHESAPACDEALRRAADVLDMNPIQKQESENAPT